MAKPKYGEKRVRIPGTKRKGKKVANEKPSKQDDQTETQRVRIPGTKPLSFRMFITSSKANGPAA